MVTLCSIGTLERDLCDTSEPETHKDTFLSPQVPPVQSYLYSVLSKLRISRQRDR